MALLEAETQQRHGQTGDWQRNALPEGWSSDSDSNDTADTSATARLEALGIIIVEWGKQLIEDNLEGLQYLLRQLSCLAARWPQHSGQLQEWLSTLQVNVSRHWAGLKLMTITSLDR